MVHCARYVRAHILIILNGVLLQILYYKMNGLALKTALHGCTRTAVCRSNAFPVSKLDARLSIDWM